ncbi:unnamed protein product [Arctogadus glacialis]
MDHTMSMQQAGMMGPLAQQMNHMSLGTTGSSTGYVVCAHSQHRIPHTLALQGIEIPNLQGANPLQIYRRVPGEHTCRGNICMGCCSTAGLMERQQRSSVIL